ncbi:MAG: 3-hydroxyacyl-CoA dehydrogenase family protein [Polyangiaceae bacterium]|nr:3-hydroxyacyl-CoA dehydrogenase family protein [Polyangiaceae bacterium]
MTEPFSTLAVIGAGTMGRGIAQLAAQRGLEARLFDVSTAQVERAVGDVTAQLERLVAKGKLTEGDKASTLARLAPTSDLSTACGGADVVIEAAPEAMDLKVQLFSEIRELSPAHALLGSNTSSLSITEIGQRAGLPDRIVGLHFFNPPPIMPLLEIVRGLSTSDSTVDRARALALELGKDAIVVQDFPGFATSRLGVILGAEAIRMLEAGVASAEDIDRAMKLGYRHPMGPLELTDLVGLDVRLAILDHLHRELGEQFRPPALLRQMVRAGRLGKKVGLGFYRWTDEGPRPAE